jgi:LuxR family maltose regulon positive regulatory protein
MAAPVLATKLYIPPPPSKLVTRPRLIGKLNDALSANRQLTLISAPAGFGKTTLVSEWIHQKEEGGRRSDESGSITPPSALALHPSKVAWLSLDENDSDPVRFLTYLIHALQTISPDLGAGVLDILSSSQSSPIESLLTVLLNEIAAIPRDPSTGSGQAFIFVLDDYHLTDSKAIDNALTFLIEHLPPRLHLVITTREDPALPIPRLRARNQLTELRAADLRFTPSEAAEFLNQGMDLNLSAEDVIALETRTEGWIAGLQLAALSMKGSQDMAGFIQAFAGDHRYIVDYLVEEVLQRQTEETRLFLLQTSILDRLNGRLCDAVQVRTGSRARLEQLQRGNLFLIPLDDKRHWYRYHHLFADVLRMHLMAEQPDQVPVLHRRASEWYEQNGFTADAIRHALAGADYERAADLIERAVIIMGQSRQESILLGWFKALPDEVLKDRPVLSAHYAGALLQNGQLAGVEDRLRDAERWLEMPEKKGEAPLYMDEEEFRRLPGTVAMYHAGIALVHGDVAGAMKHARRALELTREEDNFLRGAASSLLGLASWGSGDLERAYEMFSKGMAHLQRVGFISDVIGGSVTLADIRMTQGRLRECMSIYERGLQLATKQGARPLRGAADMHVGMSEVYRERNDLQTAAQHIQRSLEFGEFNGLPKNPYRWRVAMARIHESRGNLDEAFSLLEEAEPLYQGDFSPDVRPIAALKARVWVAQGKIEQALAWARQQGLSVDDELSYLREFEHITLARILLAQYKSDRKENSLRGATGLLERLLQAAEEGRRMGSAIEILVLQALAHQLQGDASAALTSLERAIQLAEPEGYIRIFLNEGAGMAQLIREAAGQGMMPDYTGKLLSAFETESQASVARAGKSHLAASQPLVEPLSQRELDVLRLFRTELSGPEIARELVVALSTVRTHTKSIYSKLGVNSRRAAVRRAEELGLI